MSILQSPGMADSFSQETVLDYLLHHRGKVRNADLTAHFRLFLRDPERQLQNREHFKKYVNSLAVVREEDGVKYVLLRKRYVELIPEEFPGASDAGLGLGLGRADTGEDEGHSYRAGRRDEPADSRVVPQLPSDPAAGVGLHGLGAPKGNDKSRQSPSSSVAPVTSRAVVQAAKDRAKGRDRTSVASLPQPEAREGGDRVSGDQPRGEKHRPAATNKVDEPAAHKSKVQRSGERNRNSTASVLFTGEAARLLNGKGNRGNNLGQPVLVSSTASPILSHAAPPVAKHKGSGKPAHKKLPTCSAEIIPVKPVPEKTSHGSDHDSFGNLVEVTPSQRIEGTMSPPRETTLTNHRVSPSSSKKHSSNAKIWQEQSAGGDAQLPVSSEESIPKTLGKRNDRLHAGNGQLMGNSRHCEGENTSSKNHASPKVTKSNELPHKTQSLSPVKNHHTVCKMTDGNLPLNARDRPESLVQANSLKEQKKEELLKMKERSEESSLVPLDSKEHEWIVKTSAGMFEEACALFSEDPNIGMKKDFISGYTVLHWIAKHGNYQALREFFSCARKQRTKLNVNIKSTCGYTPLHIATMYGQLKVIQYLVNKHANFNIRDHSGKKPWQYLNCDASADVFYMLGAPECRQAKPSQINSTFSAKSISRQKSSPTVSRKTSFSALLKSPHLMQKFMQLNSDNLLAISEEDEKNEN
ncbi:ankyrin repeat domain-containing protein SOWAHB [Rhinoraja longicauda]